MLININVFGYENKQKFPIYISKEKFNDHLNLLLTSNEEKQHYMLIKDFNRFMFDQTKHQHNIFACIVFNIFPQKIFLMNTKKIV